MADRERASKLNNPARILVVLVAATAVALGAPLETPARAGHRPCREGREIRHVFEYLSDKAVSVFKIDAAACLTGKASITGSMGRSALNSRSSATEEKTCRSKSCTVRLAIPHDVVEIGEYDVHWTWVGPHGRRDTLGDLTFSATCVATPVHVQCA